MRNSALFLPASARRQNWRVFTVTLALLGLLFAGCGEKDTGSASLIELTARFQAEFDRLQQEIGFPGGTAAFILGDGRSVGVATGYADVEMKTPMIPSSKILSGSVGKTFVAAVALSLVQQGKLDLEDKIAKWLGEKAWFDRLPNGKDITLRMLLSHSSGLSDYVDDERFAANVVARMRSDQDTDYSPEELVEYILDREPLFSPGQGFAYTDAGYLLVGLIIERAGGSTYYEELQKRFLSPLSLTLTTPSVRPDIPGLAAGYLAESNPFGLPQKTIVDGAMVMNPVFEWTGGGLATNPQDLVRWAKALYEGKALESPYLDELLDGVPRDPNNEAGGRYGLGVFINESDLGVTYGHGGWFPGYRTQVAYFPEHKVAVAVQINTDADPVRRKLGDYLISLARVVLQFEQ